MDIPGLENKGFRYDAVGNRLSEQGVEGEWTYNPNNELLTFATTEYTYDANGNATHLLLDGTVMFTYHYNAQDRLVQVDDVNGNTIAEYSYDPFGRRLWKDVGSIRTYFFYADEGLVAEYDASGIEIRAYGYRPDSTWTTDPLWLKQGGEYYFYQNDHLGTPQKLVKQNGAIAWSASYTAFGKASVEVESVTNNLRFPGQYYDAETGLHYNWYRCYDSKVGRYLSVDPMRIRGGVNVFLYAHNNPLVNLDQRGLAVTGMGGGFACAVGLIGGVIGPGGSISGLNVIDDNGNVGDVICFGFGPAYSTGLGFVGGVQYTKWFDAESICELHGISWGWSFGIGGASKGGGYGVAGELSSSSVTLIGGLGLGGFGGGLGLVSGCWLKDYKKLCKDWERCQRERKIELFLEGWQRRKYRPTILDIFDNI